MSAEPGRPRRRADLSQHFLRRGATAGRLVASTSISSGDLVLEIGAGRGALTRALLGRCERVVAVEIDPDLCLALEREIGSRARIVQADFLEIELPARPYKVIGNAPYARTTEIVRRITGAPRAPDDAWLVVQREAALRFVGPPWSRETGWSLRLAPWWHREIVRTLRRADFDPPPAVDSVLLWLSRRARPLVGRAHGALYLDFVARAIAAGPPLARALRPWLTRPQLLRLARDLRFDPDGPPSTLRFDQWLPLFRFVALERGDPSTSDPA